MLSDQQKLAWQRFYEVSQYLASFSSADASEAHALGQQGVLYRKMGEHETSRAKFTAAYDILIELQRERDMPLRLRAHVTYLIPPLLHDLHKKDDEYSLQMARKCCEAIQMIKAGMFFMINIHCCPCHHHLSPTDLL
jgi:hypothetical protein